MPSEKEDPELKTPTPDLPAGQLPPPVLKLDDETNEKLRVHIMDSLRYLNSTLGRGPRGSCSGFFRTLEVCEMQWHNDMSWRASRYPGSVFERCDPSVSRNLVGLNHKIMAARIEKEHYGAPGDPYFSVAPKRMGPTGVRDPDLAEQVNYYFKCKLDASNTRKTLKDADEPAMAIGYQAIKISHDMQEVRYKDRRMVLMRKDGEPYMAKGHYVTPEDWIDPEPEEMDEPQPEPSPEPSVFGKIAQIAGKGMAAMGLGPDQSGQEEQPEPTTTGRVCRWDETFQEPIGISDENYEMREIDVVDTIYCGPKADPIYWRDLIFDKDTNDLQRGTIGHAYERSKAYIENMAGGQKGAIFEKLEGQLSTLDASKKSNLAIDLDLNNMPGVQDPVTKTMATGLIVEVYTEFEINGVDTQIMAFMLCDKNLMDGVFIWRDYTGVHLKKAVRPIYFKVPFPVQNLARGSSIYELMYTKQIFIELNFCREFLANSDRGKFRVINQHGLQEGESEHIEPGSGKLYHRKPDYPKDIPLYEEFPLYEMSDGIAELRQDVESVLQMLCGVSNEAQAASANMPSSNTATGVEKNAEIASMLLAKVSDALAQDEQKILEGLLNLTVKHMDDEEEYEYTKGDTALIGKISRSQLENLDYNVTLEVTNRRQLKIFEKDDGAMAVIDKFWAYVQTSPVLYQLGVPLVQALRGYRLFCISQLRSIGVPDPDNLIPDVSEQVQKHLDQQAAAQAQQAAAAQAQGATVDPTTGAVVSAPQGAAPVAQPAPPPTPEQTEGTL